MRRYRLIRLCRFRDHSRLFKLPDFVLRESQASHRFVVVVPNFGGALPITPGVSDNLMGIPITSAALIPIRQLPFRERECASRISVVLIGPTGIPTSDMAAITSARSYRTPPAESSASIPHGLPVALFRLFEPAVATFQIQRPAKFSHCF